MQEAVAADALVEYADGVRPGRGTQPPGEEVGPSVVGADLRLRAVGDRVAERDDGRGGPAGAHAHAGQEVPAVDGRGGLDVGTAGDVPRGHVVVPLGERVERRARGGAGQVDAHHEVGPGGHPQGDRIAEERRPGRDGHGGTAAEGERPVGARIDAAGGPAGRRTRDPGLADDEGTAAEFVRQPDTDPVTADAGADGLPDRLVRELRGVRRRSRRGCGGPRPGPGRGHGAPGHGLGGGRRSSRRRQEQGPGEQRHQTADGAAGAGGTGAARGSCGVRSHTSVSPGPDGSGRGVARRRTRKFRTDPRSGEQTVRRPAGPRQEGVPPAQLRVHRGQMASRRRRTADTVAADGRSLRPSCPGTRPGTRREATVYSF
ncbi:hypothetical protein EES40_23910 [Streptomyces sp. ADI93-02]|nr:hypothetical protein EES40_23910 [Streptomyces sp. ADI93-02]